MGGWIEQMNQLNYEATETVAIPLESKVLQSYSKMRQEGRDFIFLYQSVWRCKLSPLHIGPFPLDGNLGKITLLTKNSSCREAELWVVSHQHFPQWGNGCSGPEGDNLGSTPQCPLEVMCGILHHCFHLLHLHLHLPTFSLKRPDAGKDWMQEERGWQRMRWLASPTQWTWVWVNSGRWWWTGRVYGVKKSWTRLSDWNDWFSL